VKLLGAILPDLLRQLADDLDKGAGRSHDGAHRLSGGKVVSGTCRVVGEEGRATFAGRSELETGNGRHSGAGPLPAFRATTRVARTELDVLTDGRAVEPAFSGAAPQTAARLSARTLTHRRVPSAWLRNACLEDVR
jgi:hypothetical protein